MQNDETLDIGLCFLKHHFVNFCLSFEFLSYKYTNQNTIPNSGDLDDVNVERTVENVNFSYKAKTRLTYQILFDHKGYWSM